MNVFIAELKQRTTAIAAKVRRYQGRVVSYRQNRLFENNQRHFYRELDQDEETCDDDDQPVAEESKQFWGNNGVNLQIIRGMQSGCKTCEVKFEKDTWQDGKLEVTSFRLSPGVLACMKG